MIRFMVMGLIACGLLMPIGPVSADTSDPADNAGIWECPQAGGETLFTNRKSPGCRPIELKELSFVPPLVFPQGSGSAERTIIVERPAAAVPATAMQNIPDSGKAWYGNIAPSGSTREKVCALYGEWINLNERTRGGMFFGSDPNYGSDPTGRNQTSSSYPFYDNARYVTLSRLFGGGFVPVGCP